MDEARFVDYSSVRPIQYLELLVAQSKNRLKITIKCFRKTFEQHQWRYFSALKKNANIQLLLLAFLHPIEVLKVDRDCCSCLKGSKVKRISRYHRCHWIHMDVGRTKDFNLYFKSHLIHVDIKSCHIQRKG